MDPDSLEDKKICHSFDCTVNWERITDGTLDTSPRYF